MQNILRDGDLVAPAAALVKIAKQGAFNPSFVYYER